MDHPSVPGDAVESKVCNILENSSSVVNIWKVVEVRFGEEFERTLRVLEEIEDSVWS
jgi:hypothetical protein